MRLYARSAATRTLRRQALLAVAFCAIVSLSIGLSAGDRSLPRPNYDLASRWMATKVGKLVFDTSVSRAGRRRATASGTPSKRRRAGSSCSSTR